jgi:hypothetical protein
VTNFISQGAFCDILFLLPNFVEVLYSASGRLLKSMDLKHKRCFMYGSHIFRRVAHLLLTVWSSPDCLSVLFKKI